MISPDYTMVIQFFLYILTYLVISNFLIKPLLSLIEERKKRSDVALKEAEMLRLKTEEIIKTWNERVEKERAIIKQECDRIKENALKRERDIIEQGRRDLRRDIETMNNDIQKEILRVKDELIMKVDEIADEIVRKILTWKN